MKKLIIPIIFYIALALNVQASIPPFTMGEEKNVNDIPFDTELIASRYLIHSDNDEKRNEEKNVNDIPFNTGNIASDALLADHEMFLDLLREDYVNDIPFDTEKLAAEHLLCCTEYAMAEEKEIDDIPFNTMCFLLGKASLYDVKAQHVAPNGFNLILQLPNNEKYTFFNTESFKKSFLECVMETPSFDFRTCNKDIQHDFPQTVTP